MWCNVVVMFGYVALVYLSLYRGTAHGPGWPGPALFGLIVPLAMGGVTLAVFGAWREVRRVLERDRLLAAVVAQRAGVIPLPPGEAFDAVLRALRALPNARLDFERTSTVDGTLSATTPWRWFYSNGERIDVQLFEVDARHVAVFAASYPRYRQTRGDPKSVGQRNIVRFFGALPVERPYDTTRPWQAPAP